MKLKGLAPLKPSWTHHSTCCDGTAQHMLTESGTMQVVKMEQVRQLHETTYRELVQLIDGNFLNQRVRADALKGIELEGFTDNTMHFTIESSEIVKNGIRYNLDVQFDQWDEVGNDPDFNFAEKARLLLWVGDVRMSCSCPSYLYHGYQYLLTAMDAAIHPEERPPHVKNPDQRGIVCKHLSRLLRHLPFYSGQIATELKNQFGG